MIFLKVFLLIGKKWIEEKGGSDGKTSVSCQGPPTTMIYDFADGAQTLHTVRFLNLLFFFVCLFDLGLRPKVISSVPKWSHTVVIIGINPRWNAPRTLINNQIWVSPDW